jgi:hypothetical protein
MRSVKNIIGDYTGKYFRDYFNCASYELTSLEGAPEIVSGSFNCRNNKLTSLEGSPKIVYHSFSCYDNDLNSLEGAPLSVGLSFGCDPRLKKGENLYIIANALINGINKSKLPANLIEKHIIEDVMLRYFSIRMGGYM